MIDKNKLSIRERYLINTLTKEYRKNKNCILIDIFKEEDDILFNIARDNYQNAIFDNYKDKNDIMKWEINSIVSNTKDSDIIIINDNYFKIKIKLLNVHDFFEDFILSKLINNYLGLDVLYFNETRLFTDVFYDEEKEVIWFHKKW